jgi:sensor histidine kinase regulating citrate/malate metabolism
MSAQRRRAAIATRLFFWQVTAVVVIIVAVTLIAFGGSAADAERAAAGRAMAAAKAIAHNPFVETTLAEPDPAAALQPYGTDVTADSDISFLTIFSSDGVRYTNTTPDGIGATFAGYGRALAGHSYSQSYSGPLGPAVRAVVPVRSPDGVVIGVVVAAVDLDDVQTSLGSRIQTLVVLGLAWLAVITLGAWGLSRYLRRITWGRGAEELGRLFQFYESVLHSLDEGLLLLDQRKRVVLANDRAARMLDLPLIPTIDDPATLVQLDISADIRALIEKNESLDDEVVITDELVLVLNMEPVRAGDGNRSRYVGAVVTVRDRTRIQELSGELENNAVLTDALRAQTHEFANRLHTIIALIELDRPEQAVQLAGSEIGAAQSLADSMVEVADEPVLTALLLGKSAQARERGIVLDVEALGAPEHHTVPTRELITIVGNLVDNAMDAVAQTDEAAVTVTIEGRQDSLVISVSDSGPGPDPATVRDLFELGATTKTADGRPRGVGLALVRQCVRRLRGTLSIDASTFTVELPLTAAEELGGR